MIIPKTGSIGIGTSSPTTKLYVNPRSRCEARMFKVAHMFGPRSDWTEDRIREVERVYKEHNLSLSEVAFRLI